MAYQSSSRTIIFIAIVGAAIAYLFCKSNFFGQQSNFDVPTVLTGLLAAEAEATVRPDARVAIGFGGCLDRLGNGLQVLSRLNAAVPDVAENVKQLQNIEDLEKAFAYYFSNGASAGRTTTNASFFDEVENAFLSLSDTRTAVGGNAPVMAKRFVEEGANVILAARMSSALQQQVDKRITVVGEPIDVQDTHLIFEYQKADKWGPYIATRANRFILYNSVGRSPFESLLEDFSAEIIRYQPAVLVVGGLRLLLGADAEKGTASGPDLVTRLSQILAAVRTRTRIHVELSSFPNPSQLTRIVDEIVRHADSIGLNEQELPVLRRAVFGNRDPSPSSENSHPTVRSILDDARAVFRMLRHTGPIHMRRFSRLHMHTLAFQLLIIEAGDLWPNSRAAVAKAALTANRHTCGSKTIDADRTKLLLEPIVEIGDDRWIEFDGERPVVCWTETAEENKMDVDIEICIAPVPVCKHVRQTVGGGDNVSAAGLVLQI